MNISTSYRVLMLCYLTSRDFDDHWLDDVCWCGGTDDQVLQAYVAQ